MSRQLLSKRSLIQRGILSSMVMYGSSIIGISQFVKHTFVLHYYKKYIELQGNNGPIKPTEKLQSIFNDASKDIEELVSNLSVVEPFIVPGVKIVRAGTYGTHQGGIIGLPAFFEFNSKEDVMNNIVMNGEEIFDEEQLSDLFLLSDEAKKFVIAREICLINTMRIYINTMLPLVVAYSMDKLSKLIADNMQLKCFPVSIRATFYMVVTVVGLMIWNVLNTNIKQYYEANAETNLSNLSNNYLKGAIEYYSKDLKRTHLQVEMKGQTTSLVKNIDDFVKSIFSFNDIPVVRKLAYLNTHLEFENKKAALL